MHWFLRGFSLLRVPSIRKWVLIPLLINLVIFVAMVTGAIWEFSRIEASWQAWLPDWLAWLAWLLWPVFLVLLAIVVTQTFTTLANIVASPFNGMLAEHVQMHLTGAPPPAAVGWDVARCLWRQVQFLVYALPMALLCGVMFLIPVLSVIAPPLWFAFNGWMSAVQNLDYVSDNNKETFGQMMRGMRRSRWDSWSFGLIVAAASLVPLLNVLVMPAAVCGATVMWLDVSKSANQQSANSNQPADS